MMIKQSFFLLSLLLFSLQSTLSAQNSSSLDNQVNIVFGLGQIAAGGFNIEGNIFYERLAFDYSHGVSLSTPNAQLETGSDKENNLAIHIPRTTGFGVGYRFSNWLNLRVEPKWHRFELYDDNAVQTPDNLLGAYNTFTLGLGLYANLRPFKKQDNLLKGIMIAPNFRWWPNVSSTLENDELTYLNPNTESQVSHQARSIGIANTAFFGNISVGYSLNF